jgi:hypothetical protein
VNRISNLTRFLSERLGEACICSAMLEVLCVCVCFLISFLSRGLWTFPLWAALLHGLAIGSLPPSIELIDS